MALGHIGGLLQTAGPRPGHLAGTLFAGLVPGLPRSYRAWQHGGSARIARVGAAVQFRALVQRLDWRHTKLGGGCDCHPDNPRVRCQQKGRRIRTAYAYATAALRRGLDEANLWTDDTFRLVAGELIASVRGVFQFGMMRLQWLDRIPWLLSRLAEPGVAARCLQQYHEGPGDRHHRVSHEFLQPGCRLRQHIELVQPDGSGITQELADAIATLCTVPMDDSVAEGPHAQAMRVHMSSRACSWPWIAASLRLPQNLQDLRELVPMTGVSLDSFWHGHSGLLHVNASQADNLAPYRVSPAKLRQYVYRMAFCKECPGEGPAGGAQGGAGGGPGGGPPGGGRRGPAGGGGPGNAGDDDPGGS